MPKSLTRLCSRRNRTKAVALTDEAGVIRDRIANVEAIRRSYEIQLAGGPPRCPGRPMPAGTLEQNIARCTARLAELRQQLAAL